MALQAHEVWPQRKGKPLPEPQTQQVGQDGLCPPTVPYPQFTGENVPESQNCKVPPCAQSSRGAPDSLQVAQGIAAGWETSQSAAKSNSKFRPSKTTHSLPKALPLLPTTKHKASFPNAKYNYKQAKPNKAQVSPPLLWGEGKSEGFSLLSTNRGVWAAKWVNAHG